ncbi:hypothetical protein E8E12_005565 [Didymella heteroderae]|uniref:Xylanolytic transcriptional activator regulatory domain-containing protein n=1 Tax=Didymella heteroderae TaxID=1769908 RepID=A0A9P4WK35_9PLEO|nr:hypothetical protein E8E12_005565 [Didymella heteroderae]
MAGLCSKDVTASCLVLMVLAVGTQYAQLESTQRNSGRSAGDLPNVESSDSWELEVGASFYRQVAKLISEVIHSGSVLSVQVFLLLGLYYLPLDASGLGYIYLNLAIKIAIQNGMHRDISRSNLHADTKEFRRRIWWTAYCMERVVESHTQWDFLIQDCVAAAEEAIGLCHDLRTGCLGLAKSSYTEYSSCRASLLVLIAYSICCRTNKFSKALRRGFDAIREMASVGDSARSEVSLLETLESALHQLHEYDSVSGRSEATAARGPAEEGYEGFVNWYRKSGASANSGAGSSIPENEDGYRASAQNRETRPQPGLDTDDPAASGFHDNLSMDAYPFDFNLLHMDENATFPTLECSGIGNPNRELLENLFWMPR